MTMHFSRRGFGGFRRRDHEVPRLNTAALPDLIFSVLFFFMIVTHMRDVELKVQYQVPQGTELEKLVRKSAVSYIYIGPPSKEWQPAMGTDTRIQLNDKYADVSDIANYLADERRRMSPADVERQVVSIKADKATDMGIISDVKMAVRRANALVVNYSSTQKPSKK